MESLSVPVRRLPNHILNLIYEYSLPLTWPDWRNSKPIISGYELMNVVSTSKYYKKYKNCMKLHYLVKNNIIKTDWYIDWYKMYKYIELYGIHNYCDVYDKEYSEIIKIKGVKYAQNYYEM
jgi:hypothetical protein